MFQTKTGLVVIAYGEMVSQFDRNVKDLVNSLLGYITLLQATACSNYTGVLSDVQTWTTTITNIINALSNTI